MATQHWNPQALGCIERDSFAVHPINRTLVTADLVPRRSKTSDVRAPINAKFLVIQTSAQHSAFVQWHKFDLGCGALPFSIVLWLWNHHREVRARLHGPWQANRINSLNYQLTGTMEIERESL